MAVMDAYGFPKELTDEDVLGRLLALNKERATEEARGLVRWLRPAYQVPKFGSTKDKAELDLSGVAPGQPSIAPDGGRTAFPADEVAQTAAVMAALAEASKAMDARSVSATFKQGQKVEAKVAAVLASLARMGFVGVSQTGKEFSLKRAA
jgi:hypothetical protein